MRTTLLLSTLFCVLACTTPTPEHPTTSSPPQAHNTPPTPTPPPKKTNLSPQPLSPTPLREQPAISFTHVPTPKTTPIPLPNGTFQLHTARPPSLRRTPPSNTDDIIQLNLPTSPPTPTHGPRINPPLPPLPPSTLCDQASSVGTTHTSRHIVRCNTPDSNTLRILLLDPNGSSWSWSEPIFPNGAIITGVGDIQPNHAAYLGAEHVPSSNVPTTQWAVLTGTPKLWTSPPLHSLRTRTTPLQTLSWNHDKTQLIALDLSKGTWTPLHNLLPQTCDGTLHETDTQGPTTLLTCLSTPPSIYDPKTHLFSLILNRTTRHVWLFPQGSYVEALLSPTQALISNRTHNAERSTHAFNNLQLVDLTR